MNMLPPSFFFFFSFFFFSFFFFLFVDLRWLPVEGGIEYNIATICYSAITCTVPPYLSDSLKRYIPSRTLRSSADNLTFCIPNRRQSQGQRAFSITDPSVWDTLPFSVQHAHTLSAVGSELKTHLFFSLFPPLLLGLEPATFQSRVRRRTTELSPQPFSLPATR